MDKQQSKGYIESLEMMDKEYRLTLEMLQEVSSISPGNEPLKNSINKINQKIKILQGRNME